MINWRTIVGLVLLLIGIMQLYTITANAPGLQPGVNPIYKEIGCAIWMAVGLLFIINGTRKPDNK